MIKRYKFLRLIDGKIKSDSGDITWEIGKWQKHKGKVEICESGFHCSREAYQAFSYIQGEILAIVECRGESDIQDDKEAYSEMRVVKAYKWTQNDSIDLAVYSAKMCLDNFEKAFPDDKRPREAIEAAIAFIDCPCYKHQSAARSAVWSAASAESAAWSAESARSAASAARSAANAAWSAASAESAARSAAWGAASAARSAANAARSAAWSARSAAWSARSAAIKKITTYFDEHIKKLEEYEV